MQLDNEKEATDTKQSRNGSVNLRSYLKLVGGAAVSGVTGTGVPAVRGADGLQRTLTIEGTGSTTNYEFTGEKDGAKNTAFGGLISGEDTVLGNTALGRVTSGRDSYTFSGEITQWAGDYDALNLHLNGEDLWLNNQSPMVKYHS